MQKILGCALMSMMATALGDDKADKAPSLEGKWVVTKMELAGEDSPKESWTIKSFEFKGDKVKLVESLTTDETKEYKLKLDTKAMPMEMDIGTDGFGKDCIYKFEKDKLIISLVTKQLNERPKEFKSKKGDLFLVLTLERAK
jgi:uncharacterized protein (TIGR03067 family)